MWYHDSELEYFRNQKREEEERNMKGILSLMK